MASETSRLNAGKSSRSIATSEGMRRSDANKSKQGTFRGERDENGLTAKDRIIRAVLDARANGVKVTASDVRILLPLDAKTISQNKFASYVVLALGGERNVPKGRSWPKASWGYKGDAVAHQLRTGKIQSAPVEKRQESSTRKSKQSQLKRQPDPFVRRQIEAAAITVTTEHFTDDGFTVDSVEKDNVGWDLEAVRRDEKLQIEVKGSSGSQPCIELTPNEFTQMQKYRSTYRLCIVVNAMTKPRLAVFSYSSADKAWVDQSGRQLQIDERVAARCTVNRN